MKREKEIKSDMDWKGRNKAVPICRWHNDIHRKSQGVLKKKKANPRTNKWVQQILTKTVTRDKGEHYMMRKAVFTRARTWKQPRCPSTDEWIKL